MPEQNSSTKKEIYFFDGYWWYDLKEVNGVKHRVCAMFKDDLEDWLRKHSVKSNL